MTDEQDKPLIIVDAANVVGSRPDGWWKDRLAANRRLRDRLAGLAATGVAVAGSEWAATPPVKVVMVTEGRAKGLAPSLTVDVVDAPGSGDDTIVDVATAAAPRRCLVITSDRALANRLRRVGAHIAPASTLRLRIRTTPHGRRCQSHHPM